MQNKENWISLPHYLKKRCDVTDKMWRHRCALQCQQTINQLKVLIFKSNISYQFNQKGFPDNVVSPTTTGSSQNQLTTSLITPATRKQVFKVKQHYTVSVKATIINIIVSQAIAHANFHPHINFLIVAMWHFFPQACTFTSAASASCWLFNTCCDPAVPFSL